jgi:hypothetical protein
VPELGSLGSVRGALRNERPYRECGNSKTWVLSGARSGREGTSAAFAPSAV